VLYQYSGLANFIAPATAAATAAKFIPPNFCLVVSVVLSSGFKQPGHEAYHSPPSSADVRNVLNCTYSLPDCLQDAHKDIFTFNSLRVLKSRGGVSSGRNCLWLNCTLYSVILCAWHPPSMCSALAHKTSSLQPCVFLNLMRFTLHHCVRVIEEFSATLH